MMHNSSFEEHGIENEMFFDIEEYDLDGLIRLVDSEEAALELMYFDEDDDRHYRNRYDVLECDRGISYMLQKISYYLEQDEEQGLFIAFAATYEGKLTLLNGLSCKEEDVNLGELELGDQLVYGMLINRIEDRYVFKEVVYHDGGEKSQSWAEVVADDTGVLGREMQKLILQFA